MRIRPARLRPVKPAEAEPAAARDAPAGRRPSMSNRSFARAFAGLLVVGLIVLVPSPAGEPVAAPLVTVAFTWPADTSATVPDPMGAQTRTPTSQERNGRAPDVTRDNAIERLRVTILTVAAGVLVAALLAIMVVILRRLRANKIVAHDSEPQAFLTDRHGITDQQVYMLGRKPTMIGRIAAAENDYLAYIVVPDNTVGRRHALIEYKESGFWIIDQGSTNGTYVNDCIVTTETRLKHGDRVRLHKFEFEFALPEQDKNNDVLRHAPVSD